MKLLKINKWIGRLCAVAAILVAVGVVTINSTFSKTGYEKVASNLVWDVYFTEVVAEGNDGQVIVSNDRIDANILLHTYGEVYKFVTSINNDGNFNAILDDYNITDLSKVIVGKSSITGNTYSLSDYVNVSITYLTDNEINSVKEDENVKKGDKLNSFSSNNIIVKISLKEKSLLSEDQIKVLNDYAKNTNGEMEVKVDLGISTVYQQEK